jgi:tripartite-type tricarboxylate transporter receptor subunit TctC
LCRRPAIILKLNLARGRPARSSIATITGEAIMKSSLRQTATREHWSLSPGNDRPHPKTLSSGQNPRRRFLGLAAGAAALAMASQVARAQNYPRRPVRLVVGAAPGGATDIAARLIGQWLSDNLGRQFIIENRPGANFNIATEAVVHAPGDGYTLLMTGTPNVINTTLYENLNFVFDRDIAPVASTVSVPLVMVVHPLFPARSVPEFIAYAKDNPGKVNYGSSGIGSTLHVAGEMFKMMAGIEMVPVQYRGTAPMLTDLLGGQLQVAFADMPPSIEHVRTGRLRALAVTTSKRTELVPELPTVSEFLPGYEASFWVGVGAPYNTPPEIIEKLNREINVALASPVMKARLTDLVATPMPMTLAQYRAFIADETEKWGKVVRAANIKVN